MTDFDSPWKEALDLYFQSFLALFFPGIDADIDWSRGYEGLDKEFQQLVPDAETGRLYVDKLVKVWRNNGMEQWVLIHVEIQTTRDAQFSWRMFIYNGRIFDRYNREVVSLAVLADDDPGWRPGSYRSGLWGCERRLDFPCVKLLDQDEGVLEASRNPFAAVVLAHLKALQTRHDASGRQAWKVRLVRGLFERGFSGENIRQLFRLIDWLMELPPFLAEQFWVEVKHIQEDQKMPYITTPERIGREQGRKEGLKEGLEEGLKEGLFKGIATALELKFGAAGLYLMPEIRQLKDNSQLEVILEAIKTATGLEELRRSWAAGPGKG